MEKFILELNSNDIDALIDALQENIKDLEMLDYNNELLENSKKVLQKIERLER